MTGKPELMSAWRTKPFGSPRRKWQSCFRKHIKTLLCILVMHIMKVNWTKKQLVRNSYKFKKRAIGMARSLLR